MARKAGSAEFRSYLDSFDRTADGAGSEKGTDRFSGKDIRTAFANRGDLSKAKAAKMVLNYADSAGEEGSKMGGGAESALDKLRGYVDTARKDRKDKRESDTKPTPTSGAGNATAGDNSISSPVSNANPISIDGDSNQVNQDNSVSNTQNNEYDYSVDNRKFLNDNSYRSYGADGGGGKYGGADDSPAAAARFMDMYIDSNRLNQRSMRNEFDFFDNQDYSANDRFGAQKRERGLDKSIEASRNRSKEMKNSLYGGVNPFGADFKLPEAPDPVKSNAEEIYEKALKKIK